MNNMMIYCIISLSYLFAHCQVPCGIYDDARRVIEIEEHIQTIDKAMDNILNITSNNKQTAQEMNQLVRWINTKEEHAQKIQSTLMEYFLAQRIKPKNSNEDGYLPQKFSRLIMQSNHIDHCTRLCHSPSVEAMLTSLGSGATSNSYSDYEDAGCLVIIGSDANSNHPVAA